MYPKNEFYDKCNKIVIDYFVNQFKKLDTHDLETQVEEQLTLEKDNLTLENKDLKEELEDTKE